MSAYAKMEQGVGLQMGYRPSKDNNAATSKHIRSKTSSDGICQAIIYNIAVTDGHEALAEELGAREGGGLAHR